MSEKVIRTSEPGEVMFVDGPLTLIVRPSDKDVLADAWARMQKYLHAYDTKTVPQPPTRSKILPFDGHWGTWFDRYGAPTVGFVDGVSRQLIDRSEATSFYQLLAESLRYTVLYVMGKRVYCWKVQGDTDWRYL